jgi:hypothetical protein
MNIQDEVKIHRKDVNGEKSISHSCLFNGSLIGIGKESLCLAVRPKCANACDKYSQRDGSIPGIRAASKYPLAYFHIFRSLELFQIRQVASRPSSQLLP